MRKSPPPPSTSGTTLGDLLRRKGVGVSDPPAPVPSPAPSARGAEALDFGGAKKIVLRRERKGRGGKTATVVEGINLPPSGLDRIARELKRALGCGAAIEGGTIVIQGDMAERTAAWLTARGAPKVIVGN